MSLGLQKKIQKSLTIVFISTLAYFVAACISGVHVGAMIYTPDVDTSSGMFLLKYLFLSGAIASLILLMALYDLRKKLSWQILVIFVVTGGLLALPSYFAFDFRRENTILDYYIIFVPWQVGIASLIAYFFGDTKKIVKSARKKSP